MITPSNFEQALKTMNFQKNGEWFEKCFAGFDKYLRANIKDKKLEYPEDIKGRERNDYYDDSHKENLVVFECVNRLLEKGYRPEHIELEKEWHLGHDSKSGRADICVTDGKGKMLFIVECKTFGKEYNSEYKNTQNDGGQLFSYWQQEKSCKWLVLYASTFEENKILYTTDAVDCNDDNNILASAKKDESIKLYKDAHTTEELFSVWDETYEKRFVGDVIFREDSVAYKIGVKPLRKADLKDFSENDKVVNKFEEILRHNNVSDKENAFNRLIALFICKLVDEIQKGDNDEVEFQYKVGTDTYESMQDRLQRLHKEGMEKFMREEIFYVSDDYAENLIKQYTGHKRQKMIDDLKSTLRILKFYTNNDFAFKDVHNEELFYQNGKILVEVVQLFENYRIIGSKDLQMLGDLFEQLLNKGFKQNEGQFFTPIPITRFIWDSLPIEKIIKKDKDTEYPKIIDYACGAGHFLTQGYEAIGAWVSKHEPKLKHFKTFVESKLFGIEKDYRLARVSKISLFMHGAGEGNIIFGDGLENYKDKNIIPNTFDILVANPPYSVSAFKPHLKLKENSFEILDKISNDGSEIETLFVERISQLVKPNGIAAVILPSSILNKENASFISARESILKNFYIRCITQLGSKTFGATGTNTVIIFLQKFNEPPKRIDLVSDTVQSILESRNLDGWEDNDVFNSYLNKINVSKSDYLSFLKKERDYDSWKDNQYFSAYVNAFEASTEFRDKSTQKSFINQTKESKISWFNEHFYDLVIKIESEKLTYFALIYLQTTLIITSPTDNKEQEKFLGYSWSDRKGQEGIQVKNPGGLLYNEFDREASNTLSSLIRNCFLDKRFELENLSKYYHYMKLDDMLDFSNVTFNKGLKIIRANFKQMEYSGNEKTNKLEEIAQMVNDKIPFNKIDYESYITTDNMLKDKKGVVPYTGAILNSNVTEYKKDDILISNIRPYLKKIWLSNRNGGCSNDVLVIRNNNSNSLINDYLYYALQQDYFFDYIMSSPKGVKMPRGDKNKILSFIIPVPSIEKQKKIVEELVGYDKQIKIEEDNILKFSEDVKSKFVEMFGDKPNSERLDSIAEIIQGTSPKSEYYNQLNNGLPFYQGKKDFGEIYLKEVNIYSSSVIKKSIKNDILMSVRAPVGDVNINPFNEVCIGRGLAAIRCFDSKNQIVVFYWLLLHKEEIGGHNGATFDSISGDEIKSIMLPNINHNEASSFASYVKQIDKLRFKL